MIVRLSGILSDISETHVVLDRDGIGYQVLVCGYAYAELNAQRGQKVTLHTMEYLEGSAAGGNMIPRLVGFLHPEDRAFFERFITVKNIGVRKALKALTIPTGRMAAAIESGDTKILAKLPGIGARAAEQIVAELRGKVGDFALGYTAEAATPQAVTWSPTQQDAIKVLVALGERLVDAERWMERASQLHPEPAAADEWIKLVYRIRSGVE